MFILLFKHKRPNTYMLCPGLYSLEDVTVCLKLKTFAFCSRFEFRLRVSLTEDGNLKLLSRCRNPNGKPFSFSIAFRTYFSISDIRWASSRMTFFIQSMNLYSPGSWFGWWISFSPYCMHTRKCTDFWASSIWIPITIEFNKWQPDGMFLPYPHSEW